jgi:ribosomal protein S12 methylthiotransferase accessory factor
VIDVLATLDPASGLTASYRIRPPDHNVQPLWTVAVELAGSVPGDAPRAGNGSYPLHLVGACGTYRRDTLIRAAGEAVERFALIPTSQDCRSVRCRATDINGSGLSFVEAGLGAAAALDVEISWYRGESLTTGEQVLVPAALVDHPADKRDAKFFDPSPSGAASGAGTTKATMAALLELVERDAVMVAWATQARIMAVDPAVFVTAGMAAPELDVLLQRCGRGGLRPVFGRITSAVPGIHTLLCVLDDSGGTVTAGAKASGNPVAAAVGALREALQLRGLVWGIRQHYGAGLPEVAADEVEDDLTRALHLSGAGAAKALRDWATDFIPKPWAPVPTEIELPDLVTGLAADGAPPIVVDLTTRLPPALCDMGWAAVRALAPGYQPLRMNENAPFGWLTHRLGRDPARLPHPLV